MSKKIVMIVVALALFIALVGISVAGACDYPCGCACSPGFWKQPHHFEYWLDKTPTATYTNPDWALDPANGLTLLEALQGGKDTRTSRFVVAGWLNDDYYGVYENLPCWDD